MKLVVHAPNVHEGGGRTLLLALLEALRSREDAVAILDARLVLPPTLPAARIAFTASPTLSGRLAAEWALRKLAKPDAVVLCLGNLPPLLGARGRIVLFIQNRLLVGRHPGNDFPFRVRLRMALERRWLRSLLPGVHAVVVQTPSMGREVERELGVQPIIAPFISSAVRHARKASGKPGAQKPEFDFLYVASGESHKNHVNLVAAWQLLAKEGIRPSLCLTVARGRYPELHARLERAQSEGLPIHNLEELSSEAVKALYRRSTALIYPSLLESFGLPLLEARSEGLSIIASERDYVRDVVDPEESFDPESPASIARAVKRFLGMEEHSIPMISAEQFVDRLTSGFAPSK